MRKLTNCEIVSHERVRDWFIYSPSTGKVFCYVSRLFGYNASCANQFKDSFDDWKNAIARITSHRISKDHIDVIFNCPGCWNATGQIELTRYCRRRREKNAQILDCCSEENSRRDEISC